MIIPKPKPYPNSPPNPKSPPNRDTEWSLTLKLLLCIIPKGLSFLHKYVPRSIYICIIFKTFGLGSKCQDHSISLTVDSSINNMYYKLTLLIIKGKLCYSGIHIPLIPKYNVKFALIIIIIHNIIKMIICVI